MQAFGVGELVGSTHPNTVLKVTGVPDGLICWPCSNALVKMSTPRRSTLPGYPKSGSAHVDAAVQYLEGTATLSHFPP